MVLPSDVLNTTQPVPGLPSGMQFLRSARKSHNCITWAYHAGFNSEEAVNVAP
ncbi:hypothetical protein HanXRQr2_Chr04g0186231 [Helianthus annuus]|uniref:Uncharacterized protein n=1 Tax=Helianthus annuus TaxID=4232 RepID=A0A9K3JAD9_HELAN|nr:hypothetical protein HanXRQr2_Chr04g0186231 [Helianthus annuus]